MMKTNFIALAINLSSFLFGSIWGATGLACAGALAFVPITAPFTFFVATREGPVSFRDIGRRVLSLLAQASLAYGALTLHRSLDLDGLPHVVSAALLAFAIFAIVAFLIPHQKRLIQNVKSLRATLKPAG